jgi:hypothetical protein
MTSREALQRFAEALTPDLQVEPPQGPRSSTARQSASKRAGEELDRIGI